MILKLQKIEKLINSELSSKIKSSSIDNDELLIEVDEKDQTKAKKNVDEMCRKLLVNLIIEDYKINKL